MCSRRSDFPSSLPADAWAEADAHGRIGRLTGRCCCPANLPQPTPGLLELAKQLDVRRRDDPLSLLRELNQRLYD